MYLKISYAFKYKISITLLSFLYVLERSYSQSNAKIGKSFGNALLPSDFLCKRVPTVQGL